MPLTENARAKLDRLVAAHQEIVELQARIAALASQRRTVLDELLSGHMTPGQVATALGVTRARVSQLRANRDAPPNGERPVVPPPVGVVRHPDGTQSSNRLTAVQGRAWTCAVVVGPAAPQTAAAARELERKDIEAEIRKMRLSLARGKFNMRPRRQKVDEGDWRTHVISLPGAAMQVWTFADEQGNHHADDGRVMLPLEALRLLVQQRLAALMKRRTALKETTDGDVPVYDRYYVAQWCYSRVAAEEVMKERSRYIRYTGQTISIVDIDVG